MAMVRLLVVVGLMAREAPAVPESRTLPSVLPDGERLLWISEGGVTAKQTSVLAPNSKDGLVLRQVTDGHRFLQMIYNGEGELLDCEDNPWGEDAVKLIREAPMSNLTAAPAASAAPPAQTASPTFPDQIATILDIHKLRNDCRENHRLARRRARAKIRHDAHRRPKRGLRDYMIAPGTNWCGVSHRRNDLGPFSEADRCCRRHDKCKLSITGFSRNYNQFNFRPFTISHCKCDRRFRACLKMANTGPANMVGKLFFNLVQTKCFVIKREEVCVKNSWWGKCLRVERRKVAHIRDNLHY